MYILTSKSMFEIVKLT